MAKKSSNLRRRAPKNWFAKGEYYPKVDLSDLKGRLQSSWSASSVETPAEASTSQAPTVEKPSVIEAPVIDAVSTREEEEVMSPPVAISRPPSAAATPKPTPAASAPPLPTKDALRLPSSLDLPAARPLAASLLKRRGQPILIDASEVGQVGAQCVQVLLSAKRTWEADGVSLSIVNCAPRVIEDLGLIGIEWTTLVSGELPQ